MQQTGQSDRQGNCGRESEKTKTVKQSWTILAVEKREPYRCGVWRVGDDVLSIAQRENEDAILRLKRCIAKDHWPTGYESIRTFDYL